MYFDFIQYVFDFGKKKLNICLFDTFFIFIPISRIYIKINIYSLAGQKEIIWKGRKFVYLFDSFL